MIDILYNSLIVLLVVVWYFGTKSQKASFISAFLKKRGLIVLLAVWIGLLLYVSLYMANFDYLTKRTDVDDAVDAAVVNMLNGTNPYQNDVVPRFKEMGHFNFIGGGDGEIIWAYGPYNYLPLDLVVYAGMHEILGGLGLPIWFIVTNMLFCSAGFYLLRDVLKSDWRFYIPAAGMVVLFLSMTNTSFTLLLICLAVRAREGKFAQREYVSLIFFGLAVLTKVFALVPFAVLGLYGLVSSLSEKDTRRFLWVMGSLGICAGIAGVLLLAFGPSSVLDSTVFVYSSGETSEAAPPVGGSVLGELIPGNEFYSIISMGCVLAALLVSLRFRKPVDRVVSVFVVLLLVIEKSAYSPLLLTWFFLALRLSDVLLECPSKKDASDARDAGKDAVKPGP